MWLSPFAPVVVAAVLRLAALARMDLWYDEAFTAWIVGLPWRDLAVAVAGDVHPPLWYVLAKLCAPGAGVVALRAPAALLAVLAVWLVYEVARALNAGSRVAGLAAWLCAVNPFLIAYGQEARMYALLLVAVLLAVLAVLRRWRWRFALALAVLLYTHNVGVVYAVALAVVVAIRERRHMWRWSWPVLAALALYVPWALIATRQAQQVAAGFWVTRPTVAGLALIWHKLLWHTIPPAAWGLFVSILSSLLAIVIGFSLWWLLRERKTRNDGMILAVLALGPLLAAFAVSVVWRPILIARTMIGIVPFGMILLAWAWVRSRRARWAGLAAVPVLAAVLVMWYVGAPVKKPLARFVAPVTARAGQRDAVMHTSIASYVLLSYYAPDLDQYLWSQANDLSQSLTDQTKDAMHMRQVDLDDLLANHDRVFVYYSESPITSEAEIQENARIARDYVITWSMLFDDDDLIRSGVVLVTGSRLAKKIVSP